MARKKISIPADVDWDKAREVVKELRPDWYEDFDEAEGDFMGWCQKSTHRCIPFREFKEWWEPLLKREHINH